MSGFKSFANPVQLEFDPEVSAIVGPNGSGKSNISDAIRFVLGEQRTKQMRSQKMEDIIFSGTDSEKARGAAEVRLILEKESSPDLIISRKYFRTGESEYRINGRRVRLKDIHAQFADTGLGKNGYSIVSQGGVENIIGASSSEIREIVEEAVGIAGFKVQRNETQKRLADTNLNIERIKDILDEQKRQLGPLEKQSEKTKRFLEINETLKIIDLVNFYDTQTEYYKKLEEYDLNLKNSQFTLLDIEKRLDKLDKDYLEKRQAYSHLNEQTETLEANLVELRDSIAKLKEDRSVSAVKDEHLTDELTRITQDLEVSSQHYDEFTSKINSLKRDKSKFESIAETQGTKLNRLRERLNDYEQELEDVLEIKQDKEEADKERKKLEERLNQDILDLTSQKTEISVMISSLTKEDKQRQERSAVYYQEIADMEKNLSEKRQLINELEIKDRALETKLDKLDFTLRKQNKKIEDLRVNIQTIESKVDYQENLRTSYTGYQHSIRSVMEYSKERKIKGVFGPAAELFTTEEKYILAIQVALGAKAQNILVQNEQIAKRLIQFLKAGNKGRATFLPLDALRFKAITEQELKKMKSVKGFIGLAKDLITYPKELSQAFDSLLGRVAVLQTIDQATVFRKQFPHLTNVTLDGEILYPGGAIVGGSTGKENRSVLFQSYEISKLKDDLERLKEELKKTTDSAEKLDLRKEELTSQRKRFSQNRFRLIEESSSLETQLSQTKESLENLKKEDLKQQSQVLQEEMNDLDNEIEELKSRQKHLYKDTLDLSNKETQLRDLILKQYETIASQEVRFNKTQHNIETLDQQIKDLMELSKDSRNDHLDLQREKKRAEAEKKQMQIHLKEISETLDHKEEQMGKNVLLIERGKTSLRTLEKDVSKFEESIKELNHQQALELQAKSKIEHEKQIIEINSEQLRKEIYETYELNYALVSEDIDYYKKRRRDLSDEQIKDLRDEKRKIGSVNIDAVEEYTELKERYDELKFQYSDLKQAKKDIEKTINQINDQMTTQLAERFEQLNDRFSYIFKTLFEGGEAKLDFTDPDDLLNSGIELSAQPPGKNLKHISLLSGGEKAMTAIALLFALIELNPAPFTIIDEIDAALDDSNIYRFTHYLEKMSNKNQFIIITHRKNTLRICDTINGVTMASDGVSKLCTLEIADYVEKKEVAN